MYKILINDLPATACAVMAVLFAFAGSGCTKMVTAHSEHGYHAYSVCQIYRARDKIYGKTIVIHGMLERGVHFNDSIVDDDCPNTTFRLLSESAARIQLEKLDDVLWCNYGKAPVSSPRIFVTLKGKASKVMIFDVITAQTIIAARVDLDSVPVPCKKVAKGAAATWEEGAGKKSSGLPFRR